MNHLSQVVIRPPLLLLPTLCPSLPPFPAAQQFIDAVDYLHSHRVAHRDVKLDNIVLDSQKPPRVKVCDFGFAKNWDTEANMHTQVGGWVVGWGREVGFRAQILGFVRGEEVSGSYVLRQVLAWSGI